MIEPYYKDPDCDITIYCGDCLEVMKQIPDKSIDLVLTDPPYGINYLSHWTNNHDKLHNDKLDDWFEIGQHRSVKIPSFFNSGNIQKVIN